MKTSLQSDYNDEVKRYFKDINKFKALTKEQETELGARIKRGDNKAKEELIRANLKFVVNVAKKYKGYGVPFNDLISEGNIGLIKAAEKFDFNRDVKFISYGVWWIKQTIQEFIKKNNTISEMEGSTEDKTLENGMVSNPDDLKIHSKAIQVQDDLYEIDELESERRLYIKELFVGIPKREQEILTYSFGLGTEKPLTLEEIGLKYKLTKERVRQLKEKALKKLRVNALMHPEFERISSLK